MIGYYLLVMGLIFVFDGIFIWGGGIFVKFFLLSLMVVLMCVLFCLFLLIQVCCELVFWMVVVVVVCDNLCKGVVEIEELEFSFEVDFSVEDVRFVMMLLMMIWMGEW